MDITTVERTISNFLKDKATQSAVEDVLSQLGASGFGVVTRFLNGREKNANTHISFYKNLSEHLRGYESCYNSTQRLPQGAYYMNVKQPKTRILFKGASEFLPKISNVATHLLKHEQILSRIGVVRGMLGFGLVFIVMQAFKSDKNSSLSS